MDENEIVYQSTPVVGRLQKGSLYGRPFDSGSSVNPITLSTKIPDNAFYISKLKSDTLYSTKITLGVKNGAGDCWIAAGKKDFTNDDSGLILGVDESDNKIPKFFIGNSSQYLNWDGTNLTISGDVIITDPDLFYKTTDDLDDITDGANYGKVALTSISAGRIIVAGLDSGVTERMFTDSTTQTNIEAWRHATDVTLIDGGDIYTGSVTADKITTTTLSAITANLGTITAGDMTGITIGIGTANNIFKADANGIYLGNATFASAPFRVSMAGALTATSATISGSITATTGAIGGWNINTTSIYTGTEDHSGYTANAGDLTIYSDGADASIHAKNFYIDTAGNLTCTSATITGALTTGVGSTINGTYVDSLSVAKLDAGTITSKAITLAIAAGTGDTVIKYGKADFGDDATNGFILGGDDSDSDKAKFEIGSSATKVMKYDGTDWSLIGGTITGGTIQTATGTGTRLVIISNVLTLYDSSNVTRLRVNTDGLYFWNSAGVACGALLGSTAGATFLSHSNTLQPSADNTHSLGATGYRYVNVNTGTVTNPGAGDLNLTAPGDYVTVSDGWRPSGNKTVSSGVSGTNAWDNVFADDFINECWWLDGQDDLALIEAIKPLKDKDGNLVIEEGHPKIDYETLPDMVRAGYKYQFRTKKEIENNKLKGLTWENHKTFRQSGYSIGKMLDLALGAIRQLNNKIKVLEQQLKG